MSSLPQPELNERLAAILAISQRMNSQRDLSALLDLIAREATSLLDCERASIFLLDRERNELWSKVALGSDEILRFDARRGIAGSTALTGNTINVRDAYSDPRFYTAIDDQTGYRGANVLHQRKQIGEAFFKHFRPLPNFPSRFEKRLCRRRRPRNKFQEFVIVLGVLRQRRRDSAQKVGHRKRVTGLYYVEKRVKFRARF